MYVLWAPLYSLLRNKVYFRGKDCSRGAFNWIKTEHSYPVIYVVNLCDNSVVERNVSNLNRWKNSILHSGVDEGTRQKHQSHSLSFNSVVRTLKIEIFHVKFFQFHLHFNANCFEFKDVKNNTKTCSESFEYRCLHYNLP